ncbi:MAG: multidrug efflux SMR transporter [Pseudomonadota bacterium]
MGWIYLAIAIASEVTATISLKASDNFSNATASTICVAGYMVSFYFLSLVLKFIPVGIAYAIWSGVGIVLITGLGAVWFKEVPDVAAIAGIALIIAGVMVIQLFSQSVQH